jgi:hypothetical protein
LSMGVKPIFYVEKSRLRGRYARALRGECAVEVGRDDPGEPLKSARYLSGIIDFRLSSF